MAGAALVGGCDERRDDRDDLAEARKELEETKRQAAKDVEEARAKASADIAEAERQLADAKRDAARTDVAERDWGYADRDEYRDSKRKELVDLEDEIDKLEKEAKEAKGEAKRLLDKAVADLKVRRDRLEKELDKVEGVGETEWQELRNDVDKSMKELRESLKSAWEDIKRST